MIYYAVFSCTDMMRGRRDHSYMRDILKYICIGIYSDIVFVAL